MAVIDDEVLNEVRKGLEDLIDESVGVWSKEAYQNLLDLLPKPMPEFKAGDVYLVPMKVTEDGIDEDGDVLLTAIATVTTTGQYIPATELATCEKAEQ